MTLPAISKVNSAGHTTGNLTKQVAAGTVQKRCVYLRCDVDPQRGVIDPRLSTAKSYNVADFLLVMIMLLLNFAPWVQGSNPGESSGLYSQRATEGIDKG